jgi:SAM-dependent methyltransferase
VRRLPALVDSYGFTDPSLHKQVGWESMENVKRRYEFFRGLYRPGMRVLDMGCGNGLFYDWLAENGVRPDYWGVDGSTDFIRQFTARHPEIKDRVIQADFTAHDGAFAPVLREVVGAGKPFDLAVMYGVAADFGTRQEGKEADLMSAVRAVMPVLSEDGALIVDFWDSTEFGEAWESAAFIPGRSVPPTTWKVGRVAEMFSPLSFDLHKPVAGRDFGVVAYKGGRPGLREQEITTARRHLTVFDFGDSLLEDAREYSIEKVDRAVGEVVKILRRVSSDIKETGGHRPSFAPVIAGVSENAAEQLQRQWATTKRGAAPVAEQITWRFDGLPDDLKELGIDRAGRQVESASRAVERAVEDIGDAARGLRFPSESGLTSALSSAARELKKAWEPVAQDYWDAQ